MSTVSNCALSLFFFFNDTATTEIYTLSLHDALPIWRAARRAARPGGPRRAQASRPPALFAGARLPVARRRSRELALDGLGALARPVAQRRVRAPANDRLVRGEGAAQVLELLSRQPEAGERPVADPGLDVLHAADGLERLGGGAVAAELALGLAGEQERLGTHPAVAALRRRLGLRRGVLPVLALERGVRQVERRARRERVVGKLLPETAPRRHLDRKSTRLNSSHGYISYAV